MIRAFLLMISFFTRIPVGRHIEYSDDLYKRSLITFPIVGLVIGAFLALPALIVDLQTSIRAILVIVIYIFVSGGIHLDGLADSCDGLFSSRSKDRILEIMKDSHIGSFGVIGLILYFLVFYTCAGELTWQWLFVMPVVGKITGYFTAGFSRYARVDHGMGYLFIENIKPLHAIFMCIVGAAIVFGLLGVSGLLAYAVSIVASIGVNAAIYRVIEGQTGDTIGFTIECCQMIFLMSGVILI